MKNLNKPPTLAVDFDDVLSDLCGHWISEYNRQYNDNLQINDVTDWDIGKFTKIGNEMYHLLVQPKFFESVLIQDSCFDVLCEMQKFFNIQIVSATHPSTYLDKSNWLARNLPFIPQTSYNCVFDKSLFRANILIDDNPKNLEFFQGEKVIFTKPWNKTAQGMYRVDNWNDIRDFLNDYLERN